MVVLVVVAIRRLRRCRRSRGCGRRLRRRLRRRRRFRRRRRVASSHYTMGSYTTIVHGINYIIEQCMGLYNMIYYNV